MHQVRFALRSARPLCLIPALALAAGVAVHSAVAPEPGRFDALLIHDPASRAGRIAERPEALPAFDEGRAGWQAFREQHGGGWRVWLDRRSGAPMLVEGRGISWVPASGPRPGSPHELEDVARAFLAANQTLFRVREAELVLDQEGSGALDENHWLVLFRREVDGIPVEDQRFRLYVNYGNLVAFGADRWGALERVPEPRLDERAARDALRDYMGLGANELVVEPEAARRVLLAGPTPGETARRYRGPVGAGVRFHLAWRFTLRVEGERGTWIGKVDATTGEILAFYDDDRYSQVKGGVYPVSNDGQCPDGCEQPGYPMPFADLDVDGVLSDANDVGLFECTPDGATATTTLVGPYVRISDNCGAISESTTCEEDIDLGTSGGDDCTVPAGTSAGNTHSSRSTFYHLNRIKEKGRHFLPGNTWLTQRLTSNVNINNTCNAFWNGTVNFYRSGGGCGNTGEIGGVIHHEYGHGIDQNDGGGYDNPSEAYADVVAIIQERRSCVGRGFWLSQNCTGYGDTCLDCTGIRDMDWDKRQSHTPATPQNFIDPNCGGGGGACGRQVHCESYPPSEAMFDLATRDLPAMGLDPDTAWQLTERLFYASRQGSGGDIYNCTLPDSDSCTAGSWFQQLRTADDDDGNLDNGTPHAAALFAAFDRHAIACGDAADPSNQNSSSCPALAAPVLQGTAGSNAASLSWDAVADAADYLVLRTEVGCQDYSMNVVDAVAAPATSYVDDDLANDFAFHFRIQARAANQACNGPVSNCVSVTPQPFAGSLKLDRSLYACDSTITLTVRDANTGSPTVDVTIFSDSEPDPETVTLTETAPGSARFVGTIEGTADQSTTGDGMLGLADGDLITAHYIDADDGQGGRDLTREATAGSDCVGPRITGVGETGISDTQATIVWSTDQASDSVVRWGEVTPPSNTASDGALVTSHSVTLSGLQQCTVYFYQVESTDEPGNLTIDDNRGVWHHFETLGDFGQGLQPCHQGRLTVQAPVVGCSASLPIELIDIDLNPDAGVADTVVVSVTSSTETTPEPVTLTETGPNTSTFTGSISTAPGPPVPGDGLLQSSHGDLLTATYQDADDGSGASATAFDTADADCRPASFLTVEVIGLTDESAVVRWVTDEPTTGRLEWGTGPALGDTVAAPALDTTHTASLAPLDECGRIHFRVFATDRYGNDSVADSAGVPFEFNAYEIPGAVFKDGFESDAGWTLGSEWEIGAPQGLGTDPGDPTAAFAGARVLGHDLSGQGANPGDYEPNTTTYAVSPVIDASALTNAELKIRRWLNVGGGGISGIDARRADGTWVDIWDSHSVLGETESSWTLQTYDLSAVADGNPALQVRFEQFGGFQPAAARAGWNVDRLIVRDGAEPEFGACGACGGAPTFAGVSSAVDDDPCADSGVTLSWEGAPAWGTGSGGTYAVYRDTAADFVPSPANLVAGGIAGTTWTDAAAPDDVTLYYVVRAENDEACGVGPNNGGLTDDNLVRAVVRDDTSQVAPGDLGDTLRVDGVNHAHPRLSWVAVPDAARYNVYRGNAAQGPFERIAETAQTAFEDRDEFADPNDRYYLVRASDACGNEGP